MPKPPKIAAFWGKTPPHKDGGGLTPKKKKYFGGLYIYKWYILYMFHGEHIYKNGISYTSVKCCIFMLYNIYLGVFSNF